MAWENDLRYADLLRPLPVRDLDLAVFGRENACFRRWVEHGPEDEYWRPAEFLGRMEKMEIPVFHQSGWFDGDGIGGKLNPRKLAEQGRCLQKLILGPWGHTDTAERMSQGRDFGENAVIDLQREYLRWFDRWLKGIENGIEEEPLVSLLVMGANRRVRGQRYPLEGTGFRRLYLSSGGSANTSGGDGRLSFSPPVGRAAADHYVYDPGDPTPDFRIYQEAEEDRRRVRPADERGRRRRRSTGESPKRGPTSWSTRPNPWPSR